MMNDWNTRAIIFVVSIVELVAIVSQRPMSTVSQICMVRHFLS